MKHSESHKYRMCVRTVYILIFWELLTTFEEQLFVALLSDTQQNIKQDSRNITLVRVLFDLP